MAYAPHQNNNNNKKKNISFNHLNLNVLAEVVDGAPPCVGQMVVHPAEQQLLRRKPHQLLELLPFL